MNKMKRLSTFVIATLAALGLSSTAIATTFDYSYTFTDGESINGTFTGTLDSADPNLIKNIGSVTAQITGTEPYAGYTFNGLLPGSCNAPCSINTISTSGAVVSLNGLNSNFFFTNNVADDSTTNWFYVIPNGNGGSLEQARLTGNRYIDFDNRFYNPANFRVVAEASGDPQSVPEPATIAIMGLGLFGVIAARRKSAS